MNWIVKGIGAVVLCGAIVAGTGCSSPNYGGSVNTYFGSYDGSYSSTALNPTIGTIVSTVDSNGNFAVTLYGTGNTAVTATASGTVVSNTGASTGSAIINGTTYSYTGLFTPAANGATGFSAVLQVNTSPTSTWNLVLVPNGNTVNKARPH
ncbi:MAG TPA: hypothetical protein VGL56_18700 [Fimbriimonadaceae bacterium]|jgi:hypothetical protein